MASVIVSFRIMPTGTDVDLEKLETDSIAIIKGFVAMSTKTEKEPIAFGLVALKVMFVVDEAKGDTEPIEKKLMDLEDVQNVEVTDVRRTFG